MASERLYGLVAEDLRIEKVLRVVIPRIIPQPCQIEARVSNRKIALIRDFHKSLLEFKFRSSAMYKALVICDADRDAADALEQELQTKLSQNPKLSGLPFPVKFHAIRTELETWLLADSDALSRVIGHDVASLGGNLETLQNAKEKLIKILQQHRNMYPPSLATEIARSMSLDILRNRCPGFQAFELKTQNGPLG